MNPQGCYHPLDFKSRAFASFAITIIIQFVAFSLSVFLAMYYIDTQPGMRKYWTDKLQSLFGFSSHDLIFGFVFAFAMIGLVFFNGLHTRVRVILHQLESIKIMLVNRHDRLGFPPAAGRVPAELVELIRSQARA